MKIFSKTPKAFVFPVALLCSSVWADVVYINENGLADTLRTEDYIVLSNQSIGDGDLAAGVYVIEGEVTFNSKIWVGEDVHIILADGASLVGEATGSDKVAGIAVAKNISIYGQSKQTGKLSISGFSQGITSSGNVTICGGVVEISATKDGIYAAGELSVTGGSIIASGTSAGIYAGKISFSGASNTVVSASSIFISNEPKTVSIADGKSFICENQLYSGSVSPNVFEGKTFRSYNPPIVSTAEGAVVNGNYNGLNTIAESYIAKGFVMSPTSVTINRNFSVGTYSTLMLPFDVNTAKLSGVQEILRYSSIETRDGKKVIVMKRVWNSTLADQTLEAYTPYMVKMNASTLGVTDGVTFADSTSTGTVVNGDCASGCDLKFYGSFAYKKWTESDLQSQTVYGFAAENKNGASIGQFVKVGAGASIRPFRAYMANVANTVNTNGNGKPVMSAVLPDEMEVVVEDDNGEHTTVIGRLNTRSGEFMMNRDYDLKGRHVGNKAKVQGAYYGKKVLKK